MLRTSQYLHANFALRIRKGGQSLNYATAVIFALMILLQGPSAFAAGEKPKEEFPLTGNAKECSDRAWKKIKATGRSYNVERRGYDEKTKQINMWIGDKLFVLPEGISADNGFGYPRNAPGISATIELRMPDMTHRINPDFQLIEEVSPSTITRISCITHGDVSIKRAANRTREDSIKYFAQNNNVLRHDVPELNLIGYSYPSGKPAIYFPKNTNITNPSDSVLAINCDEKYPPKRADRPFPKCSVRYVYRDGIVVNFSFPEHYLKYWHVSYERLLKLLNSSLVEQ